MYLQAQESHYSNSYVGGRSTMLCGSMLGSVRDNSSIYYNPGGLAFSENSSFSLGGDVYYYDYLQMENAVGKNKNLYMNTLNAHPQLVSGVIKSKKRPWLSVNYAYLNKHLSRVRANKTHQMDYDVFPSLPQNERYSASFEFEDVVREDWLGAGFGYRINENLGLGFSVFATFRSQRHKEVLDINVFEPQHTTAPVPLAGTNNSYMNADYLSIGIVPKVGISYEMDNWTLGGTLTFPRIPVHHVSRGSLIRSEELSMKPQSNDIYKAQFHQDKLHFLYKSPLSIEAGLQYSLHRSKVYATLGYFHEIKKYRLIKPVTLPPGSIQDALNPGNRDFTHIMMASKPVFNVALGYEHCIQEHLNLLFGLSTDFNPNNWQALTGDEATLSWSTWNIYHASGGFEYETDQFSLTLGFNVGGGGSQNQAQLFNFDTPNSNNALLGTVQNEVNSFYLRTSMVLGFTYYFN